MIIEWTDQASNQLEKEVDYISKDDPIAASNVVVIIFEKVELLKIMPHIGRLGMKKEMRELVISNLPYFIRYKIEKDKIHIINIFHTSRNLED